MTAHAVTLALSGNSEMVVTPRKPGVSDPLVARPQAELFFVTSPTGTLVEVPIGEAIVIFTDTYHSPLDSPVTFQAFVDFHDSARIAIEHLWDFGDGVLGWGSTVVHTYTTSIPFVQASLRVTDDLGRRYYARQQIYLPSDEPDGDPDGDINLLL